MMHRAWALGVRLLGEVSLLLDKIGFSVKGLKGFISRHSFINFSHSFSLYMCMRISRVSLGMYTSYYYYCCIAYMYE